MHVPYSVARNEEDLWGAQQGYDVGNTLKVGKRAAPGGHRHEQCEAQYVDHSSAIRATRYKTHGRYLS